MSCLSTWLRAFKHETNSMNARVCYVQQEKIRITMQAVKTTRKCGVDAIDRLLRKLRHTVMF